MNKNDISNKTSDILNSNTGFVAEFKKFISKGNVLDFAVGMIIGSAFTSIVSSLVSDIITPLIGTLLAGVNFSRLVITIPWGDEPTIAIGYFINAVIRFFITALCLFLVVKTINKFFKKDEKTIKEAKPSEEVLLLQEIRDLLKKDSGNADQNK